MKHNNTNDNIGEQDKPAFTPGPWAIMGRSIMGKEMLKDKNNDIKSFTVRVAESCWLISQEKTSANHRLIACAPEMLEALELLLCWFSEAENGTSYGELAKQKARDIIAKARGE